MSNIVQYKRSTKNLPYFQKHRIKFEIIMILDFPYSDMTLKKKEPDYLFLEVPL